MSQTDRPVIPNVFLPKALGVSHIIYAVVLTGVGLIWAAYFLGIPLLLEFAGQKAAESIETRAEADRQALGRIDEQIAATADGKAKDELLDQRLELQVNQEIPMVPVKFPMFGMADPRVAGTVGFEVFTGLFFYLLMFIAGFGLIRLRRWGRALAVVVAALKAVQVIVVGGLIAFAAAPTMANGVRDAMTSWQREQAERPVDEDESAEARPIDPPRMTPEAMGESVGQLLRLHAAGTVIFGLVYPLLTLTILNQRSVRVVFDRNLKGQAQAGPS